MTTSQWERVMGWALLLIVIGVIWGGIVILREAMRP